MPFWKRKEKQLQLRPAQEIENENPVKDAPFTTGAKWKREQLREYIRRFAIPVTPAHKNEAGVAMDDAYSPGITNAFTAQGTIIPDTVFAWYASQGFIGWQACAILAQHWLVAKACAMAGDDAVAAGWKVARDDGKEWTPEATDIIRRLDKKYKIEANLKEAAFFRNVFGIRLCLFVFDDFGPDDYARPFDPKRVRPGTYKGISQIDPYFVSPQLTDNALKIGNRDFYVPEYWQIRGNRIHRSHFVILYGKEVADVLKPTYVYGGIPLTQRIYERVYAAERTANEAPQLALAKRLTVRYVDLAQAMSDEQLFTETVAFGSQYQDNFGTQIAGLEERVERFDTALGDLDTVTMTQYQIVAAIAEVPATKLLGTSPKGFGASGDYEIKSYHESLRGIQTNDLERILSRHYKCMALSDFENPGLGIKIVWEPIDKPSAMELAELNDKKADTDIKLQGAGAIDGQDIRKRVIEDENSGYTGIEFEVPQEESHAPGEENPAFGQAQNMGQPAGGQPPSDHPGNPAQNAGGNSGEVQPRPDGVDPSDDEGRGKAG